MKWLWILAIVGLAAPAEAGPAFRRRSSRVPGQVTAVRDADLDGDGWTDLVVVYRRGAGRKAERFVAIFFREPTGYRPTPSLAFEVPERAALFDVGPLDGVPGDEIAYLSDSGVWAHGFVGRKGRSVKKIASAPALVGAPEPDDLPSWPFVRPLTRTSTIGGVIVPGFRELHLFRPQAGEHALACRVRPEMKATYAAFGAGTRDEAASLRVTYAVPNLALVEATGDGRVDLLTYGDGLVAVHPGTDDGCFSRAATRRQLFSLRTPEEERKGSGTVMSQLEDLDGDGIVDLVLTKVAGGLSNLHTEVRFHRGEKGGGFSSQPVQTFRASGFAAYGQMVDVDGDGKREWVRPRLEMGVGALAEMLLSSSVTVELEVLRAARRGQGFFEDQPAVKMDTSIGFDFSSPNGVRGSMPLFGHDFDGDGRLDVLLSSGSDSMGLHRGRAGAEPFDDDADFELEGPGSFQTHVIEPGHGARPEVMVWYPGRDELDGTVHTYEFTPGR